MIARNNTPPVRDGEDPPSARVPSPASQSGPSRPDRGPSHDGTAWDGELDEDGCYWARPGQRTSYVVIMWVTLALGALLGICGAWKLIEIIF